jgi:hypothetical protein
MIKRISKKGLVALLTSMLAVGFLAPSSASAATKIALAKTTEISYDGEKVAISLSDFPEKSGLYLFQCVQPANGVRAELAKCNSADQLWITSSGRGSFLPAATNIEIRLVGKFGAFDCAVDKCALFAEFDRFFPTDRSEDQMIPLTFTAANQAAVPVTEVVESPKKQSIGKLRSNLRVGQSLTLPSKSDQEVTLSYRLNSKKNCVLKGNTVTGRKVGTCSIAVYAPGNEKVSMLGENVLIKIRKKLN